MAISQGDVIRVVASLIFPDNVIMQNVFHLVVTAVVGTGDDDEVVADMVQYIEDIYDELDLQFQQEIVSAGLKVYVYDSGDDDFDEVGSDVWDFANFDASDALPHGVAAVVNFPTVDPDVQGRKYFGGFGEQQQDASTLIGTCITALGLAGIQIAQDYVDPVSSNEYDPGVWSPTEKDFFGYGPSLFVKHVMGYQRRRKPGVGI